MVVPKRTAGKPPFLPDMGNKGKKKSAQQVQRKRKAARKLTAFTEMFGFKLPEKDDPILQQFKKADDESRPLRLVINQ